MPTVDCPSCGCKLRVTVELLGASVQCPRCATTFTGPEVIPPPLPAQEVEEEPAASEEVSQEPPVRGLPPPPKPLRPVLLSSSIEPGPQPDGKQACPVCGNREEIGAERCAICNTKLREAPRPPELPPRRDYEPDRGSLIATMGTLSVLFSLPGLCGVMFWPFAVASAVATGLGTAAQVMSHADLEQMERNIMDPQGREKTMSGQAQGLIGTVLGVIGLLLGMVHLLVFFND